MSEWLTTTVSPSAVMRQLIRIEEECEGLSPSTDIGICRGPFGAFRLASDQAAVSDDLPNWPEDTQIVQDTDEVAIASGTLTPRTQSLFQSILEYPEEDPTSSTMHMWNAIDDSARIQEVFESA
jgi:arginine metabolism regulation protein II